MAKATTTTQAEPPATDSNPAIVHASFNYYAAPTPPRLNDLSLLIGGSTEISSHTLPVADLRSLPVPISSHRHETHGFQVLHQELPIDPSHASVHDPKVMTTQYYPAMMSLLKKELGVRATAMVNNTMRDPMTAPPFLIAHSDYTAAGARAHFRTITRAWVEESQTEEEREEFFRLHDEITAAEDAAIAKAGLDPGNGDFMIGKGGHWDWDGTGYEGPRYGIFSIWRPWETVKRDPLAVMSSSESDLQFVAGPRTYLHREGYVKAYYSENAYPRPPVTGEEENHKWYYLSEQKPEEVYCLKLYDSEALKRGNGSVSLMAPHSAFRIEGTEDAPPRRSCELRVWCIW